jgi:hypothetical protein
MTARALAMENKWRISDVALVGPSAQHKATENQPREPRHSVVRDELLDKVPKLRQKVGHSLSVFVLKKYAGGAEPEKIGHAKLTIVFEFEKLTDISDGIARLQKAAEVIGEARYSAYLSRTELRE